MVIGGCVNSGRHSSHAIIIFPYIRPVKGLELPKRPTELKEEEYDSSGWT